MVEIGNITPPGQLLFRRPGKKVSNKSPAGREHEQQGSRDKGKGRERKHERDEQPHFDGYA